MLNNAKENVSCPGVVITGKLITLFSLMLFTYANNLWLIPNYFATSRRVAYFVGASLLVIVYSIAFTSYVKVFINVYPIKTYQIIFLSVPFSKSWALSAFVNNAIEYAITYAIWLFIFSMAWFMNDYSRQQQLAADAQKKQIEVELDFLKNQLNPHFLFNTLNNLYALALKKSDSAPDAILKLSSILRYLLYDSNKPAVPFAIEQEIMEAYIDLELLRLSNRHNLSFTIQADKPYEIQPLLWLPVLENVFKHGTNTLSKKHFVDYRFVIEQNKLQIYSRNNSNFNNITGGKHNGGIGLNNLRKRLALLYPNSHKMEIRQTDEEYIALVEASLDEKR